MDKNRDELEKKMSETLEEGDMRKYNPIVKAQEQLIPKYEIRIPIEKDPIIEETRIIREIAQEVDDRYDKYVSRDPKEK